MKHFIFSLILIMLILGCTFLPISGKNWKKMKEKIKNVFLITTLATCLVAGLLIVNILEILTNLFSIFNNKNKDEEYYYIE